LQPEFSHQVCGRNFTSTDSVLTESEQLHCVVRRDLHSFLELRTWMIAKPQNYRICCGRYHTSNSTITRIATRTSKIRMRHLWCILVRHRLSFLRILRLTIMADHCVEMLRQFVMCHADVGLVTAHWIEQRARPWPDFNTKHTCRNFDGIWQWTVVHQMPEGTPMIPLKPDGAKALASPP
jgi:hypothetical protein